ncbi:hypothetical protein S100390_v1c06340 [Spiroplasma sp. NBRC 100390]|uniref:hypothetical protein n=1 Tax=unclassified Spiroplasma TaxID=2637901 RepID=UPI0008927D2B|nr:MULTISPECIES: hypothetical protein [unclassified Spiroplasma]AOX43971.1 hypothetical protein STU14_v1c06340 [Spiroplasma sp. TU-14]APE13441.1 hypothetical protein S100390_v1c06340 [Spiroplasma sp. NBRC 100390]
MTRIRKYLVSFKLSKKKPYNLGHNALSENTFFDLVVEWLSYDEYQSIDEAISDIKLYVHLYNFEWIYSKWNVSPLINLR